MASVEDFTLREAHTVEAERLTELFDGDACLTPYCIDEPHQQMIFVQTAAASASESNRFFYQAQFRDALRVVAVPYAALDAFWTHADGTPDVLPIYSVGRCGSTLVCSILRRFGAVRALSEPDIFTSLSHQHECGVLSDERVTALLDAAVRSLDRALQPSGRLIIKLRAPCHRLATLFHARFPASRALFVYRGAIESVDSYVRVFGGALATESMFRRMFPEVDPPSEGWYDKLGRAGRPLLRWILGIARYRDLRRRGVDIAAFRYETLCSEPRASVEKLFAYCDLKLGEASILRDVMGADVHAGTPLAWNRGGSTALPPSVRAAIPSFLETHFDLPANHELEGTLN